MNKLLLVLFLFFSWCYCIGSGTNPLFDSNFRGVPVDYRTTLEASMEHDKEIIGPETGQRRATEREELQERENLQRAFVQNQERLEQEQLYHQAEKQLNYQTVADQRAVIEREELQERENLQRVFVQNQEHLEQEQLYHQEERQLYPQVMANRSSAVGVSLSAAFEEGAKRAQERIDCKNIYWDERFEILKEEDRERQTLPDRVVQEQIQVERSNSLSNNSVNVGSSSRSSLSNIFSESDLSDGSNDSMHEETNDGSPETSNTWLTPSQEDVDPNFYNEWNLYDWIVIWLKNKKQIVKIDDEIVENIEKQQIEEKAIIYSEPIKEIKVGFSDNQYAAIGAFFIVILGYCAYKVSKKTYHAVKNYYEKYGMLDESDLPNNQIPIPNLG